MTSVAPGIAAHELKGLVIQKILATLALEKRKAQENLAGVPQLISDNRGAGELYAVDPVLFQECGSLNCRLTDAKRNMNAFRHFPVETQHIVMLGALVEVSVTRGDGQETFENYFIVPALGGSSFEVAGETIDLLTCETPRAKCLFGKVLGDEVMCRGELIRILSVC